MPHVGEGEGLSYKEQGVVGKGRGGGRTMDLAGMNTPTAKGPNLRLREVKQVLIEPLL